MRELKFRFIDTGDGTVYKPITLKELLLRVELPRRVILESENGDFVDTDDFLDLLEKDELIAEQYTGHEDKNGKEICEGDIVNWDDYWNYAVKQGKSGAWLIDKDELFGLAPSCEVIGNIHENPELLEGEKND